MHRIHLKCALCSDVPDSRKTGGRGKNRFSELRGKSAKVCCNHGQDRAIIDQWFEHETK